MRYTIVMVKRATFQLDPKGGEDILQRMMMPVVDKSAKAIAARARGIASSQTQSPPLITVETKVGIIRHGQRAIATVKAEGIDNHANYIGHQALVKSKDAGRVSN